MSFILTFLFIIIIFALVTVSAVFGIIRRIVRFFTGKSGYGQGYTDPFSGAYRQRQQSAQPTATRGKVFSRSDGEYVDFEELPGGRDATAHSGDQGFEREDQVSDAEWTDVK